MRELFLILINGMVTLFVGVESHTALGKSGESRMIIDVDKKRPGDLRTFDTVTLENGLEVLLVSDKGLNKSAAALDVAVGSLEDPSDALGLAHFLEHMLFLGTKKYPDVDDYKNYLQAHQGYSNAYTAAENTNYHFEVNHDGFEGALDRFAQFFTEPLFNSEFVKREMNAVHSEHQKNLKNDYWRSRMVLRSLHREGHPRQKFSTGDLSTLEKVDQKSLISFYKKHYSANQMKLVVLSPLPADKLKQLVKTMFAKVPTTGRKSYEYPSDVFDEKKLPEEIRIEPVKNIKELTLQFATPSPYPFYKGHPERVISHLVGHEGVGSLLSLLKKEDLATTLSSGFLPSTYSGTFNVTISLTDKGVAEKKRVIELFFSYMKLLQKEGYQKHLYEELKTMGDVNFVYREPKEGAGVASALAGSMHIHKALEVEKNTLLFKEHVPKDFQHFLSFITPDKLRSVLVHKGVKVDKKEKYYGTEYAVEKIDAKTVALYHAVPINKNLKYPDENKYLPSHLTVYKVESDTPKKIRDDEFGVAWFQPDLTFNLPKGAMQILIESNEVNKTPQEKAMSILFVASLNESLNEWKYPISMADLEFAISRRDRGIVLDLSGFSDKMPDLLEDLSKKLKDISISEAVFASIKEEIKRDIANFQHEVAYRQALYQSRYLLDDRMIHQKEYYDLKNKVDLFSKISLKDVKKYATKVFSNIGFEVAVYGNFQEAVIKKSLDLLVKNLSAKPLDKKLRFQNNTIKLTEKTTVGSESSANNHCYVGIWQFGERDFALNAALRVGNSILSSNFFTELRTKQQLGYIVHAGLDIQEKVLGHMFLVQSSEYDPLAITKRVEAFFAEMPKMLKEVTSEEFAVTRQSVADELRQKEKTIREKLSTLQFEAIMMKGTFGYKERVAKFVEKLTQKELIKLYEDQTNSKNPKLLVYHLFKSGHKQSSESIDFAKAETLKAKLNHW